LASKEPWAFLLWHDDDARDSVHVALGDGSEPGREVFSGMRVTFPTWSPKENKLSLWFTFSPLCRSWLSLFLATGLRPGDRAAVFDVQNGQISWLAINGQEKVQVGHYYLLKKQYAEAWKWYSAAERELPPPRPPSIIDFVTRLQGPGPADNFTFFQSYCLSRLGRQAEARAKLAEFRETYLPRIPSENDKRQNDPQRGMDQTVIALAGLE